MTLQTMEIEKVMKYSFSRLSLAEECMYRFYSKYILGIEQQETKPLALGQAVHTVLENLLKGIGLDMAIRKGMLACGFHENVTFDEVKELVERALWKVEQLKYKKIMVESHFDLNMGQYRPTFLQGYIDVVDFSQPIIRITDWKSGWKTYNADDTHQLGLYAWVISKIYNVDVVDGELYFLRKRKLVKKRYYKDDMERSRDWAMSIALSIEPRLTALREALDSKDGHVIKSVVQEEFPRTPNKNCKTCPLYKECASLNIL